MFRRFFLTALAVSVTTGTSFAQADLGALTQPCSPVAPLNQPVAGCCDDGVDCCNCCCECCRPVCGPPGRFWIEADYLLWWIKGDHLPPLVTGSPPGTPRSQAGVLGAPGTAILFGNNTVNNNVLSGARFNLGYWLNCEQTIGIEGNFFFIGPTSSSSGFASPGSPILARPFFNALTNKQDSELVAFPGVLVGGVTVHDSASTFNGQGLFLRRNLCCGCCYRLDLLGGWQRLGYNGNLGINEALVSTTQPGVPPGTTINVNDYFGTTNTFNGFALGFRGEYRWSRLALQFRATAALGGNNQTVFIAGSTVVTEPGLPPVANQGGLLALQSNIGNYHRDRFVVVPMVGFNLAYQLTNSLRLRAGYTFLYWADTFQPGAQVDFNVNPNLIPPPVAVGPNRPAPLLAEKDIWIQGINLGLEFRF